MIPNRHAAAQEEPKILKLENVSKNYVGPGETVHAVVEASLAVDAGGFVTLLGPSGSGKSTLLQLAAGILHPNAGKVRCDDEDISAFGEKEIVYYRRTKLGFIFQHFNLMPGTAAENVALPMRLDGVRRRDALAQAAAVLKQVGVEKRVDPIAVRVETHDERANHYADRTYHMMDGRISHFHGTRSSSPDAAPALG